MSRPDEIPPSFVRRHTATTSTDPDTLVVVANDEVFWVRRAAATNPATPTWILDLLERAGASPDLRGNRGDSDPTLTASDLARLAECGPFGRELAAEHPAASSELLGALAELPSVRLRRLVAAHPNCNTATACRLWADREPDVRRVAASHQSGSSDLRALLERAGADHDLISAGPPARIAHGDAEQLADLGGWGLLLAARLPTCPEEIIRQAAESSDWRIRSAALENPASPRDVLTALLEGGSLDDLTDALHDSSSIPSGSLVEHPRPEVRIALCRSRSTDSVALQTLLTDREPEIRQAAARHPRARSDAVDRLVRAGSTPDLLALAPPDPAFPPDELRTLAREGPWARQLAVRHPKTPPDTLARLMCDQDPRLREWAAAHPAAPPDVKNHLARAGGATDFQGVAEADPTMTPDELGEVAALGPWAAWVVSFHPNSPEHLRRERAAGLLRPFA